jgi:hypothetical protein
MKGDFTRDTFDPLKHFSRVLMQQDRLTLDADDNEQATILLRASLRPLGFCIMVKRKGEHRELSIRVWATNVARRRICASGPARPPGAAHHPARRPAFEASSQARKSDGPKNVQRHWLKAHRHESKRFTTLERFDTSLSFTLIVPDISACS